MSLDAQVGHVRGSFALDVALAAAPGEVVAVVGPNGAGKSTLLRCLAGLLPLHTGHVRLAGAVLDDPATGRFVAASDRRVGVVFQDYLLFAHLSALENVAFGLRARGVRATEARRRARDWLARVGLADLATRQPAALSGGQAQRVALARALATEPALVLLDEPLAALDAATRPSVRREVRRHLDGLDAPCVLVTHDPVDAYALADRVVVLDAGAVVQEGTLAEVAAQPRTRYVAELVGVNLLTATATVGGVLVVPSGGRIVPADPVEGTMLVAIAPHAVALYPRAPDGSPRNVWASTVAELDHHTDRVRVRLDGPVPLVAEITRDAEAALGLAPGDRVWASVKATEIAVYPA
jgi:molybdate transport system ATP-binding protein